MAASAVTETPAVAQAAAPVAQVAAPVTQAAAPVAQAAAPIAQAAAPVAQASAPIAQAAAPVAQNAAALAAANARVTYDMVVRALLALGVDASESKLSLLFRLAGGILTHNHPIVPSATPATTGGSPSATGGSSGTASGGGTAVATSSGVHTAPSAAIGGNVAASVSNEAPVKAAGINGTGFLCGACNRWNLRPVATHYYVVTVGRDVGIFTDW